MTSSKRIPLPFTTPGGVLGGGGDGERGDRILRIGDPAEPHSNSLRGRTPVFLSLREAPEQTAQYGLTCSLYRSRRGGQTTSKASLSLKKQTWKSRDLLLNPSRETNPNTLLVQTIELHLKPAKPT